MPAGSPGREVIMQMITKPLIGDPVNNIICAIRRGEGANTLIREVQEFETVVRTIGQLLTPAQRGKLNALDAVKALFEQDHAAPAERGYCGTLGGFGTEELEEWERTRHSPIP
jgi:hypothetical protein